MRTINPYKSNIPTVATENHIKETTVKNEDQNYVNNFYLNSPKLKELEYDAAMNLIIQNYNKD